MKKLHLGSGTIAPKDWINIDGSWNAWLAKYPLLKKIIKFTGIVEKGFLDIACQKIS